MKITPNKLLPFAVKIVELEKVGYSTNGNARFKIAFDDMLGWCGFALTKSDSDIVDLLDNKVVRVGDWVQLSFTRNHRINNIVKASAPDYVSKS